MSSNTTVSTGSSTSVDTSSATSSSTMSSSASSSSVDSVTSSSSAVTSSSAISSSSAVTSSSAITTSTTPSSTPVTTSSSTSSFSTTTTVSTSTPTTTTITPSTSSQSVFVTTSTSTSTLSSSSTTATVPVTTITSTSTQGVSSSSNTGSSASSTSSGSSSTGLATTGNSGGSGGSGGLSTGGVTAIAVVVPVVVVAILVIVGILLWRKRKQKKAAEEARRKEVEDYGYNPNNDPTLPTIAAEGGPDMAEDSSNGYRGWGAATASSRKMSTTLSGGHTQGQLSDAGSNLYAPMGSPNGQYSSDGHSIDPLVQNQRETMNSDELGALGMGAAVGSGVPRRGPSNASSTYSHVGARSDTSDDRPDMPIGQAYDYQNTGYGGYNHANPYGDGAYGGSPEAGMPVVRDVTARRNTRIQQPGNYQQGNSGIAQNF